MMNRRQFLKLTGALGTTALVAPVSLVPSQLGEGCADETCKIPFRSLNLYNIHTGERLKRCVYWIEGQYQQDALMDINRHFRDHRNDQVHPIDPKLVEMLFQIQDRLETKNPLHLISGYRSPATNNMLCNNSDGVARNSQHLYGKAADIRIEGVSLRDLQKVARALGQGGVGYYPGQFVHVDTGRVRSW